MTCAFAPFGGGSRVVSLWEMLELNASEFYSVVSILRQTQGRIDQYKILKEGELKKTRLAPNDGERASQHLKLLYDSLITLGTPVTAIAVQSLLEKLSAEDEEGEGMLLEPLRDALKDIDARLRDELSLATVLVMEPERKKYFDSAAAMFGDEVADKLPEAIPDIEDAGKCLACGQGTAAVFHSMRVMEAALKSLAKLLGIPYAPSWESYIRQIEDRIGEKHKSKTRKWKRDEAFFREMLGNLQSIKIGWRNPTMHIVRRYSEDEAEEIFVAVRSFVKRLSLKLPDPPKPRASRALSGE